MIVFSFLLVLAALGLLVVGLLSASQVLIWGSIVASAAAGLCLVMAVVRQRRSGYDDSVDNPAGGLDFPADDRSDAPTTVIAPVTDEAAQARTGAPRGQTWAGQSGPDRPHRPPGADPEHPAHHQGGEPGRPVAGGDAGGSFGGPSDEPGGVFEDPPDEPVEEHVSAADVRRTADLSYDVLVVDGRPRYHLVDCPHLRDREPVSLPLAEARESGFTSCSVCRPDTTLAGRTRERFGG